MLYSCSSHQTKNEKSHYYHPQQQQEEEEEEERELEIDLDYNEYVEVRIKEEDEPLDLSMKTLSKRCNDNNPLDLQKPKLPRLDIRPNFEIFTFQQIEQTKTPLRHQAELSGENKGSFITELEVTRLLEPYVKNVHKKFLCTVCDMKFSQKAKALTHVENKHVDCLQYKCPLCRASKVTRLAYESHLRRGHNARVDEHSALIRLKKKFCVKSEAQSSQPEARVGQPYDLEFVTYLRHSLAQGEGEEACACWLDQDQAIFQVTRREEFSGGWFAFKVRTNTTAHYCQLLITDNTCFRVSRLVPGQIFMIQFSQNLSTGTSLNRYPVMILSSKYTASNNC